MDLVAIYRKAIFWLETFKTSSTFQNFDVNSIHSAITIGIFRIKKLAGYVYIIIKTFKRHT